MTIRPSGCPLPWAPDMRRTPPQFAALNYTFVIQRTRVTGVTKGVRVSRFPDIPGDSNDASPILSPEQHPPGPFLGGRLPGDHVGAGPRRPLLSAPAYAANPVTPGTYRGLGFDQCEAPEPVRRCAPGSGSRRSARPASTSPATPGPAAAEQPDAATWVHNQLSAGWHLMPITLGPQAACSTRYPRYGRTHRPDDQPEHHRHLLRGPRAGERWRRRRAVTTARDLGIVPGSTLFYDLEAFDTRQSTACTWSALWFVHSWTRQLHSLGYASGFYSSAASGDPDARRRPGPLRQPDHDARPGLDRGLERTGPTTSSSYIRSDGWQPYSRVSPVQGRAQRDLGRRDDQHRPQLPRPARPEDLRWQHSRTGADTDADAPTPAPAPGPDPHHRHLRGRELHHHLDQQAELPARPAPAPTPGTTRPCSACSSSARLYATRSPADGTPRRGPASRPTRGASGSESAPAVSRAQLGHAADRRQRAAPILRSGSAAAPT